MYKSHTQVDTLNGFYRINYDNTAGYARKQADDKFTVRIVFLGKRTTFEDVAESELKFFNHFRQYN